MIKIEVYKKRLKLSNWEKKQVKIKWILNELNWLFKT